jgi:hypothetical protein
MIGAHPELFLGGWGADPEALYNLCLILKIMLQNHVVSSQLHCTRIYVHTNITCSMTQSRCPIFLFFFKFYSFIFQNSNVLVISLFQRLVSDEGEIM